jgi:hypothetical protein
VGNIDHSEHDRKNRKAFETAQYLGAYSEQVHKMLNGHCIVLGDQIQGGRPD